MNPPIRYATRTTSYYDGTKQTSFHIRIKNSVRVHVKRWFNTKQKTFTKQTSFHIFSKNKL